MKANRFARNDRAATAIMEDIPVFIVITLAIGIFVLTGLRAIGAYKAGWSTQDEFEEGFEQAQLLRASPAFLKRGVAQAGEFDMRIVAQTQVDINREGVEAGRELLGVGPFVKVRILDTSGSAAQQTPTATDVSEAGLLSPCPTYACAVFVFANAVDADTGTAIVHYVPVSLRISDVVTHGALLEVTVWTP